MWVRIPTTISRFCAIVLMAAIFVVTPLPPVFDLANRHNRKRYQRFSLYACKSRGSNEMRSNIFTSIANVIRFSAEGTQMLRKSSSQRSHLKSCADGLLRLLGAVATGINPANGYANYASTAGLIPATATEGSCPGSWVKSIDERGIDAIDHQRLTQTRSQRYS